jgi:hypothetical protein
MGLGIYPDGTNYWVEENQILSYRSVSRSVHLARLSGVGRLSNDRVTWGWQPHDVGINNSGCTMPQPSQRQKSRALDLLRPEFPRQCFFEDTPKHQSMVPHRYLRHVDTYSPHDERCLGDRMAQRATVRALQSQSHPLARSTATPQRIMD